MATRAVRSYRCIAATAAIALLIAPGRLPGTDLTEVVNLIGDAVVRIDTDTSLGSGVLVAEGKVVTNFHVIEGGKKVSFTLRSSDKPIQSTGYWVIDPKHDLAILQIPSQDKVKPLELVSELPKIGESVAAFGAPLGLSFSITEGIVSAIRTGEEMNSLWGTGFGKAKDATWIQTTAPISPGNSGGPLVNMKAEVVGINTRVSVAGQNLNFAISVSDVKRLLDKAAKVETPTPYEKMPRQRGTPVAPNERNPRKKKGELPDFRLELPTGRIFSLDMFVSSSAQFLATQPAENRDTVVMNYPSGHLQAVAHQVGGLLDGVLLGAWENQAPMIYATYAGGKRHGLFKTWDETGRPILFAQYVKNMRHGFACLFVENDLRLICEYKNDQIQYVQLLSGFQPQEGFHSREEAENHTESRLLLEKLAATEQKLKTTELSFRKSVSEAEKANRRALAAQLGSEKRARASQRRKELEAKNAAVQNELWRRFLNQ